jgi:hypothetical protein
MRKSDMKNSNMRGAILAVWLVLLAACAGTPEIHPATQAIRDYVEVGELQEADRIRTRAQDAWTPVTEYFVLYKARDGRYLLEFSQRCREMFDNTRVTPDRRTDHNHISRGFDTLRGCRIDKIYPLTEAQAQEIEALVEAAGGGN